MANVNDTLPPGTYVCSHVHGDEWVVAEGDYKGRKIHFPNITQRLVFEQVKFYNRTFNSVRKARPHE